MTDMLKKLPDDFPKHTGKGKILRVKEGYNPNSSSLGSIVFSFPAAMLAVPVIFSAAAAIIASKFTSSDDQEENDEN